MIAERIYNKIFNPSKISRYIKGGKIPWSMGYYEYKRDYIRSSINDQNLLDDFFLKDKIPNDFGVGLDERVVEYPWIFSRLRKLPEGKLKILDAGSTFNFDFIVESPILKSQDLTILTFYPEKDCFWDKRISYCFNDLRDLPFKDGYYDVIVSQSTIEHIDMDNSIYGYEASDIEQEKKSYEYLKAVSEMERVLKSDGTLLISFPYGKFENHGFFQQFDKEMLDKVLHLLEPKGKVSTAFYRYKENGWIDCRDTDCVDIESYNPHTGRGKKDDGAAHCRSIVCIELKKN